MTIATLVLTPRFAATVEREANATIHTIDLAHEVTCPQNGQWSEPWRPAMLQPDFETTAAFDCEGQPVSVYVAAYASALQGRELVSSSHVILPEDWDRIVDYSTTAIETPAGRDSHVVTARVEGRNYRAMVWSWYEIDGRVEAAPLSAKFRQLLALLRGRPAGGRMVVIAARDVADAAAQDAVLQQFVDQLSGVGEHLPPGATNSAEAR